MDGAPIIRGHGDDGLLFGTAYNVKRQAETQ